MVAGGNRLSRLMVEECFKWAAARQVRGRGGVAGGTRASSWRAGDDGSVAVAWPRRCSENVLSTSR